MFEGVRGSNYRGDIALDDFQVSSSCPPGMANTHWFGVFFDGQGGGGISCDDWSREESRTELTVRVILHAIKQRMHTSHDKCSLGGWGGGRRGRN